MLRKLLLLTLLAAAFRSEAQTSLYVDTAASGTSLTGLTWSTAFKTLNEALVVVNAAPASTQFVINVAKGNYYPTRLQYLTNRDSTYLLTRAGVLILGGFPNGGGTRNVSTYPTVLNGNINDNTNSLDNSNHIMVIAGASGPDSILLDGLTFALGSAKQNFYTVTYNGQTVYSKYGAGLYNVGVSAQLRINNCTFYRDTAIALGGAMYNESASPIITNCNFNTNYAQDGGAIWSSANSFNRISGTMFQANRVSRDGGAIFNMRTGVAGAAEYINCQFNNNTATRWGGAIYENSTRSTPARFVGGNFAANTAYEGGGIYFAVDSTAASAPITIRNTAFNGNLALNAGGGLYASFIRVGYALDSIAFFYNRANLSGGGIYIATGDTGTKGTFTACGFSADSAAQGGAIYNDASRTTITRCIFEQNKALKGGALFTFSAGKSMVQNSRFTGNLATQSGGAVLNYNSRTVLEYHNCLFSGNKAIYRGGAICDSFNSSPLIINCTLAGDTAFAGNGIGNVNNCFPYLGNSIVWEGPGNNIANGTTSFTNAAYSTIQAPYTGLNISSANPLFVAPAPTISAPTLIGDYHVLGCSPTINAGKDSLVKTTTDLDGNPRIYDTLVDQGAYEYPIDFPSPITGDTAVCVGSTLKLGNYTAGGTWTSGTPAVATIGSNGVVAGMTIGTTVITYTLTGACPAVITRNVRVDSTDITVTKSGSSTATANQGGATYQWINCVTGNSPIAGQTNQSFTPASTGSYAVIVNHNGCVDTSACIILLGVNVANANLPTAFNVFPNPANSNITVVTDKVIPAYIRIADLTGKTLQQIIPTGNKTTIDLSSVATGMYMLEVSTGTERQTTRISVIY